jgi:hypothetical protein
LISDDCASAVALIDKVIGDYVARALVSSMEVIDLLLDIRTELTKDGLENTI